jgi:hypothetical protein
LSSRLERVGAYLAPDTERAVTFRKHGELNGAVLAQNAAAFAESPRDHVTVAVIEDIPSENVIHARGFERQVGERSQPDLDVGTIGFGASGDLLQAFGARVGGEHLESEARICQGVAADTCSDVEHLHRSARPEIARKAHY